MDQVTVVARCVSRAALAALVVVSLGSSPAFAARHARLSTDLEDHLAAGSQTIRVIVHGTRTEVDALAARYNLRITRYLKSGAVLRLTAGQLAALSDDQDVEHLSGDVRFRASEVTAESIGADQVLGGQRGPVRADGRRHRGGRHRLGHRLRSRRAEEARARDRRLHGGERPGRIRARHARGGDHRGPERAHRRHGRLPRHRAGRVHREPAGAGRRRVGLRERRRRGDRLGH